MRRRCGGTFTLASESNRSRPLHRMRPRSGAISPAIMLTTEVLPEPEGPNSAMARLALSKRTTTENRPSCFSTLISITSTPVQPGAGAAREPCREHEREERHRDRHDDETQRRGVAARHLGEAVDRRRDGLRLARNVGDERDGGAEFT